VTRLASILAVGLLLAPHVARAQESWNPYSTTVYSEGPGFRLGSVPLVLHPGIAIEGGYDNNIQYSSADSRQTGSGLLRLRAHLDLATLPIQRREGDNELGTAEPKVEFRFSTQVEYREYLSSLVLVQDQRSVNLQAGADLAILPKGPFTLRIQDTFVRTVDPRNAEGPQAVTNQSYTRDFNRGGFIASFKPGTGRLEVGVGDYVEFNLWEDKDLRFGNTVYDEAQAFARFKFLAQTIGSVIVRAGYRTYLRNPTFESAPVRVLVGARSFITSWFSADAAIGYGNSISLAPGRPSFNSVIAKAEARFHLPRGSQIAIGYDRDFFDSLFANFFVDDRLYLTFEQPLIYRITAHVDGGVRFRHYEGLVDPAVVGYAGYSSPTRDDLVYDAHAELNIRATKWLSCGVSYNLLADHTDFAFLPATGAPVHVDFIKHSVFARVDFAY
jgi:hypothetical protein